MEFKKKLEVGNVQFYRQKAAIIYNKNIFNKVNLTFKKFDEIIVYEKFKR